MRVFVAVELDEPVRARATKWIDGWRDLEARINWVARQNMHLTLKFLGDVEDRDVPAVCTAVQQAAAKHSSFGLKCVGVGAFPAADRARTIWIGVDTGHDRLTALAEEVDRELHAVGYPMESRRYHGHLTLGRVRDPSGQRGELRRRIEAASDFDAGPSLVHQVVVFASELRRGGPNYEVLARIKLRK